MNFRLLGFVICVLLLAAPAPAAAQQIANCKASVVNASTSERIGPENWLLLAAGNIPVQIDCDEMQFFADSLNIFNDRDLVIGTGHIVFVSGGTRIAADRMEFNTKTRTGVFYNASGTTTLGDRVDKSFFGTREPDAMFYGAELHKVGPKKYKIVRGGFTTCVQPTPRWEMVTGSATIVLEEHAILRNTVLNVKGVPIFYLPVMYYPIQEDDRATGFLMPIYGNSIRRGQSFSNQFFWAISRSQDATFSHDWFSKTGQGMGGEYRYVASPTSDGNFRTYWINEHEATFANAAGDEVQTPARRSYEIRGAARHALPFNTRLTANADYFSDVQVRQQYQQNLYDASSRSRNWAVNTSTAFKGFTLLTTTGQNEFFDSRDNSTVQGHRPRVSLTRGATRIGTTPLYVGGSTDFSNIVRFQRVDEEKRNDFSLARWDGNGILRLPFPRFSFLGVNSTLSWRGTYYSQSQDPTTRAKLDESIFRSYFDMRAQLLGPSFVRIWHSPERSAKHLIEPMIQVRRSTLFEDYRRIIRIDGSDSHIGGSIETTYGGTSRLMIKPAGEGGVSREVWTTTIQQTHYANPDLSQIDPNYSTSFLGRRASNFSPLAIITTLNPTLRTSGTLRLEYDTDIDAFQSITGGGNYSSRFVDVSGNYSRRLLRDPNNQLRGDNFVNASTVLRTLRNTLGGAYTFDYNFTTSTLIQQRVTAYYNAQCCGIAMEYQVFNYPNVTGFVLPQDRRFNLSFTLAGIGTFSNFLGAFGGAPDRR
jgi:LPS-assembly protein